MNETTLRLDRRPPAALAGRCPVLSGDRIYSSYGSLMLTFSAIASASYTYLIGASIISVGSTRLGIAGYLIGLILGFAFVSLAGGAVSYRYGVDTVDAAKPSLGMRGSLILLFGVLACTLGWANVLLAMTGRAMVHVLDHRLVNSARGRESEVVILTWMIMVSIWLLLRRGAANVERVAAWCAALQLAVAGVLFLLILHKYGATTVWTVDVAPVRALASDGVQQLTYAIEFGLCSSLGMLPYIGGLTRLVRNSRHLVGPPLLGYTVFGAFFIALIGGLAAATTGEADPASWIVQVAGTKLGYLLLAIILAANLGALVTQIYLAAISVQQIRSIARLPWQLIVALVLLPGSVVAFNTQLVIDHIMNWLAYNGILFVGIGSVLFVDFFLLRGQKILVPQLFAAQPRRLYWFWGGVNCIAIAVILVAAVFYLWLFDPMSLRTGHYFRYAGATIPTALVASTTYYLLMKTLVVSRGAAGYRPSPVKPDPVTVNF